MAIEKVKEETTLALLYIDGQIVAVRGTGTKDLRRKVKEYPDAVLMEVWKGRKLPLKKELKVSF